MTENRTTEQHLKAIAEQGYSVIKKVLTPSEADDVANELLAIEQREGIEPYNNRFEGAKTVRIYNLLIHGPLFEQIPIHERVLPIVEGVLDKECLISSISSISIGPGETAQPLHGDDQVLPIPRPHVPLVCNTMWALTDFTEENGATRLVPGSHLYEGFPDYENQSDIDTIPAEMKKGDVLIWNGSLWHGGGANRTQSRRVGIAMNYCAGFIRQQENQQLGIPRQKVETMHPRLQELIGFGTYRNLIGHIDRKSPISLLRDHEHLTVWDLADKGRH